jgi:hypothetical protein
MGSHDATYAPHAAKREAEAADAEDARIIAVMNARRAKQGKHPLTQEQEELGTKEPPLRTRQERRHRSGFNRTRSAPEVRCRAEVVDSGNACVLDDEVELRVASGGPIDIPVVECVLVHRPDGRALVSVDVLDA